MLGVIYRFTPLQTCNFMSKWVELTSEGLIYFQSDSSDQAQAFFPVHTIKDVRPIVLFRADLLLSKLGSKDPRKKAEERVLL